MDDADHPMYVHKSDRDIVLITIHVDDLIVGGNSLSMSNAFLSKI